MTWLFSNALLTQCANSHCLPERVAESLAASCSDGEPCALWNSTHMPHPSWLPVKTTKRLSLSRSGMTYALLTDDLGAELLTSFLAGFLVRTLAQPERVRESPGSAAVCGHTWRGLSVKCCPNTSTWKTAQCLWDEDLHWSSVTLPRWGMTANGVCWERMTWVRPTSVSACGSWPTPTCSDATRGTAARDGRRGRQLVTAVRHPETHWPTPTVCGNYNRKGLSKTSGDGLATAVKNYPTPSTQGLNGGSNSRSAAQKRGMYPTPTCHMAKEGDYPSEATRNQPSLTHIARRGDQTQPTMLNPAWVEWLMGWPVGWTDLKPLETDKYRSWLQQHGKS